MSRSQRVRDVALAAAVAVVIVGVVLAVEPSAMSRSRFTTWTPLVSVLGVALWSLAAWLDRTRPALSRVATTALVGVAVASVSLATPRYVGSVLTGDHVRAWNVFHYHLGSKYFDELGYTELYAAVLAADDAWQAHKATLPPDARAEADAVPDFRFITRASDLRTYTPISRAQSVAGLQADLSPERLAELGHDSRALRPWLSEDTWRDVFADLGYNPAPPWTVLGRPLATLVPPEGLGIWALANSDLPLWIATIGALWWGFGPRVTAAAVLFWVSIPFNEARWTGGLLQYDWLAASVVAFACWRRGYGAIAGALLSWAAMTRIFPGLFMAPLLLAAGAWLWRRERPVPVQLLRAVGTFLLCCTVLFVASHTTGRGLATWPEWVDNIVMHTRHHPITNPKRLGVKRLALHAPTAEHPWAQLRGTVPERLRAVQQRSWPLQLLGLVVLLPALFGRKRTDAMLLMLYVAFVLTVASRYYGSLWILMMALSLPEPDEPDAHQGLPGVWAGAVLLAMPAAMAVTDPDDAASYFLVNYLAWAMFVGACGLFVLQDRTTAEAQPSDP